MSSIKVLFEAGPLVDRKKTGVGYYIDGLVSSLGSAYTSKLALTGYYFDFLNRNATRPPKKTGIAYRKIWLVPGKLLSVCRRLGFQPFLEVFLRQKADIVLYTNYVSLPRIRKLKRALVVYDLSFLDHPEFTQSANLTYLKRFCAPSIRKADLIITISQFTKERLAYHFPDLQARVVVTPIPPVRVDATDTALTSRLKEAGVQNKHYILYLSTIEPRKNVQNLVEAYSLLPASIRSEYSLVLAGGKGWKDEAILASIDKLRARGHIIIQAGYISDEEKAALYSNAACFTLPSHYEGFGMPILEAMQYSLPVAVSNIAVFHEVAGDAALYFDKDSPADIAHALVRLLSDKLLSEKLAKNGLLQLAQYSWSQNAKAVFEAFETITHND